MIAENTKQVMCDCMQGDCPYCGRSLWVEPTEWLVQKAYMDGGISAAKEMIQELNKEVDYDNPI